MAQQIKSITVPIQANPLASFFRKNKLSLHLPSKGRWYPEGSLTLDSSGGLPIFAMTAGDDIKFKTGDAALNGRSTYELILSCAPGITQPELIPTIDIDAILLAIRFASYGDDFTTAMSVPNTTLTRNISISLSSLLNELSKRKEEWDSELVIEDETGQSLSLLVNPVPLKFLFSTSKNIQQQKKILTKNFDSDENIKDEAAFSDSINKLTDTAIDLICSCVAAIKIVDAKNNILLEINNSTPQDKLQIGQLIKNMDIEYFNAIKNHLEEQRKKYAFKIPTQISVEKEITAGAPKEWSSELTFQGSNFFPEQKKGTILK